MVEEKDRTMMFRIKQEEVGTATEILKKVCRALEEKGYNPISQIVGYILSGDPAYITSYKDARSLIRKIERDELIEELVRSYLEENK